MDTQNTKVRQAEIALIEKSGEFDTAYYLSQYPDVAKSGINPIVHYVYFGASEGRNPNTTFTINEYRKKDATPHQSNPFADYLVKKTSKKSKPAQTVPLASTKNLDPKVQAILDSGVFDTEAYIARYPGTVNSKIYKEIGQKFGAVAHYVKHSLLEGQNPCEMFDNLYYVSKYQDLAQSDLNPLIHFLNFGWKELRTPSKKFDTAWYWLVHQSGEPDCICPLSHFYKYGKAGGLSPKPESPADLELLDLAVDKMLEDFNYAEAHIIIFAEYLQTIGRFEPAEKIYSGVLKSNPEFPDIHNQLAKLYARKGLWWQVIDSLTTARAAAPQDADIVYRLGDAYEKMNQFNQAMIAYSEAISLDSSNHLWYYRLGHVLRKLRKTKQADLAFAQAVVLDPKETAKRLGVGLYDQERGYWKDAACSYQAQLMRSPREAELHYRLGMALDRCYKWDDAKDAYETAISLDPTNAYWHYRLGFVHERLENYVLASEMYSSATEKSAKFMPYWRFRQGFSLLKAERFEEACVAFIKTRPNNKYENLVVHDFSEDGDASAIPTVLKKQSCQTYPSNLTRSFGLERTIQLYSAEAEDYFDLGEEYERTEDWVNASNSYEKALMRANEHHSDWFYRLGYVLFRNGSFEDASYAFSRTMILNKPYGVDFTKYQKNPKTHQRMAYAEYLQMPIRQKTIVYESYLAGAIGCNPLAIFNSLLNNPSYAEWLHVWVVNNNEIIPKEFLLKENVIFIKRQSDAYTRYLATASHLINNVTFPEWFVRRSKQKYLNTWHGTPIKHLGKDIHDEFMAHKNVSRNFLHATHLLSPNEHTSDVMMRKYDIDGIYSGLFAETGYPRIDSMINMSLPEKQKTLQKLGLDNSKQVVLYAPTWRGLHGHQAKVNIEQLQSDLLELSKLPCHVVFRGHHLSEAAIADLNLPVAIAEQSIDTGELLSVVDLLVTDYSSIFFDFLPTKKPIVFYLYDLEEYSNERGLYFDYSSMPGDVCKTIDTTTATIEKIVSGTFKPNEKYLECLKKFCPFEDGKSTHRAIEFFFNDDKKSVTHRYSDNRKSLLFYPGTFVPNGITSSCINLLSNLPIKDYQISIIIDPAAVSSSPERLEKFGKIPKSIHTIARVGQMVMTPEEVWILDRFNNHRQLETPAMWDVLISAYRREYQRILSATGFDSIVNFEGYSYFWSSLLGLGKPETANSVMFMHNDMKSEWEVRHPYLSGIFSLYAYYKSLVSVSKTMHEINQVKLGDLHGLSTEQFKHCINTINPIEIISRANQPMDSDLKKWIGNAKYFITLGRLSPEKDQAKLVKAIHNIKKRYPDIKLIILGDGPLKNQLSALITDLGLENNVLLGGLRENPFPILKRAQCFVLPSNHEGQPMVLLESMALGKPIVATNIDGNRGVLKNGYGELVENSVEGLTNGLQKFLSGNCKHKRFDANTYMKNAIEMFRKNIDIPKSN